jgi:hypothetical protein
VKQGREWTIRYNEEIDNIIRKNDMVRFVKARRMLGRSRRKNGGQNAQESDERENLHQEIKG